MSDSAYTKNLIDPHPVLKAFRTRAVNMNRRIAELEQENERLRAHVERLQALVADMQDLRKRWRSK